ncbi:hypothetical protein [Haladaptatus litoreus]|nr:hypothetical protein [Haladaptatus litoreus]
MLGRWTDGQSVVIRIVALLGGLVAFRLAQMGTYVAEGMSDVGLVLVGIPVIVVALLSLYVVFVTARSFWRDWRGRRPIV